jgi:hypothetical protein
LIWIWTSSTNIRAPVQHDNCVSMTCEGYPGAFLLMPGVLAVMKL